MHNEKQSWSMPIRMIVGNLMMGLSTQAQQDAHVAGELALAFAAVCATLGMTAEEAADTVSNAMAQLEEER